jgi:hypothetical protein
MLAEFCAQRAERPLGFRLCFDGVISIVSCILNVVKRDNRTPIGNGRRRMFD